MSGGNFCWVSCALNGDAQKRLFDFSSWLKDKREFHLAVICLGLSRHQDTPWFLVPILGAEWRPACLQLRRDDPSGAEGTMGELEVSPVRSPAHPGHPAAAAPVCMPGVSSRLCSVAGEAQTLRSEGHMGTSCSDSRRDCIEGLGGSGLLVVARTLCLKP